MKHQNINDIKNTLNINIKSYRRAEKEYITSIKLSQQEIANIASENKGQQENIKHLKEFRKGTNDQKLKKYYALLIKFLKFSIKINDHLVTRAKGHINNTAKFKNINNRLLKQNKKLLKAFNDN